jgi:hypothetical protein
VPILHVILQNDQEDKCKEKIREQREGWEVSKKELQSSHEAQVQALEATYQNQVNKGSIGENSSSVQISPDVCDERFKGGIEALTPDQSLISCCLGIAKSSIHNQVLKI